MILTGYSNVIMNDMKIHLYLFQDKKIIEELSILS